MSPSRAAPNRPSPSNLGVSRETFERLEAYVALLLQWQGHINLIAPSTIPEIWTRHIQDSVQLHRLKPEARLWVDLGSGGGLPGLVLASILVETPGSAIHLVESNGKKASFLRHVATELQLPAIVHSQRIEDAIPALPTPDVVTARALSSLTDLIGYSNLLLKSGAVGLFPKGRDAGEELTEAQKSWHFTYALHESTTDAAAKIVELRLT
ncbi:MAG: 16S rRNA (guanine(527)-N(7))-methyltransferase RsmG [Rhizobiales bacterium PAR1]|nr:MAG: 16S rRNA (guanine(527)-N(7))-methyltransferase RsmG [Rhizobiales bacterium PAR1]